MFVGKEKVRLLALIFANILAWASFFSIILLTNPKSAGVLGTVVLGIGFVLGVICSALLIWQLKILKKN